MRKQVQSNYDAFISYRHSDLDSFVAAEMQKQLESFKLPRNIAKKQKQGRKTRIERVFRDSTELPLAANLSDPIMEALGCSEFLIVICTPRLKESIWCQKEIETFISLHGRERVLAVLAEGEPHESFPQQICIEEKYAYYPDGTPYVYTERVEPLAADVRGKNKREIKKKIKDEIIRMAAPMFDTAYDDLKQRHRERKLRRGMALSMAVTAAVGIFGISSAFQARTIKKQSETIKEQYDNIQSQYVTIEEQYAENLAYQADICINVAEDKIDDGLYDEALSLAKSAVPKNLRNPEFRINNNLSYIISESLRVYDDGEVMNPYATISVDSQILFSDNVVGNYVYYYDSNNMLTVYDTYEKKTISQLKMDDQVGEKEDVFVLNDGKLLIRANKSIVCLDEKEYKVLWTRDMAENGSIDYNVKDGTVVSVDDERIVVINPNTGEVLRGTDNSNVIPDLHIVDSVRTSGDSILIVYNTKVGVDEAFAELFYNTKHKIARVDTNSFSLLAETEFAASDIYTSRYDEKTDSFLLSVFNVTDGDLVNDIETNVLCYNGSELSLRWNTKLYEAAEYLSVSDGGDVFAIGSYSAKFLDMNTGKQLSDTTFLARVLNYYVLNDGRYMILESDGNISFQVNDGYEFFSNPDSFSTRNGDLVAYIITDSTYVAMERNKTSFTEYTFSKSGYLKEVQNPGDIMQTDFELLSDEKKRELDKVIDRAYVWASCYYADLDDKYYVLSDGNYGYILRKDDNSLAARIHDFHSYDTETNTVYINTYNTMYEVKLFTLEELCLML